MNRLVRIGTGAALALACAAAAHELPVVETGAITPMPAAWVDKDTGHKVAHLAKRAGDNQSFYFNNNPFVPASGATNSAMVFYGATKSGRQLFSVDLQTGGTRQLTDQKGVSGEIVGVRTRRVYYQSGRNVYAAGIDDRQSRLVCTIPDGVLAEITTLNSDETVLSGFVSSPEERELLRAHPKKSDYFGIVFNARLKRSLFTIDVKSGAFKPIYSENAWLNHVQFSPADPKLLMFCHEGPWDKVDRIWTLDVGGGKPTLMHKRTREGEIAGHEFFSPDGKRIWFDLQTPRGKTFFLAGTDVRSGEQTRYSLARDEWSIHYTISPDGKLFAGDGGDAKQVARAKDGMWIYLFRPENGRFRSEKLVNMQRHAYHFEPNVHFSPDGQRIIFRANFEGHPDIYAVDIAPAVPQSR